MCHNPLISYNYVVTNEPKNLKKNIIGFRTSNLIFMMTLFLQIFLPTQCYFACGMLLGCIVDGNSHQENAFWTLSTLLFVVQFKIEETNEKMHCQHLSTNCVKNCVLDELSHSLNVWISSKIPLSSIFLGISFYFRFLQEIENTAFVLIIAELLYYLFIIDLCL